MRSESIHGYPIIGFVQTEVQDEKICGYITVFRPEAGDFVTAWYRDGDTEWSHGNYAFADKLSAYEDMLKRAKRAVR